MKKQDSLQPGDRIRQARIDAGISQVELATMCGISKQCLYKYESKKTTNIPLEMIQTIANKIGVPAASLMGWEEKEKPTASDGSELSDTHKQLLDIIRRAPESEVEDLLKYANFLMASRT